MTTCFNFYPKLLTTYVPAATSTAELARPYIVTQGKSENKETVASECLSTGTCSAAFGYETVSTDLGITPGQVV